MITQQLPNEAVQNPMQEEKIKVTGHLSQKAEKDKKGTFSKIKSYMVGSSKKPDGSEESHLLRLRTDEFIRNLRKYDTEQQDAESKHKIIWKTNQENVPLKKKEVTSKPLTHQEKEQIKKAFLVMKLDSEAFLKDDKNYHDKERKEYNNFLQKHKKPEEEIWASSKSPKDKSNIVKKVKGLFSPHLSKKSFQPDESEQNKILRDLTSQFLKKHQYLIHKEEIEFKKKSLIKSNEAVRNPVQEEKIKVTEQMPQKAEKAKKGTFSKIKSYMVGHAKKPDSNEENYLLRVKTDEFLKNLKNYDADQQLAESKKKIVWISSQQSTPKKKEEILLKSLTQKETTSKPLSHQEKELIKKVYQVMKKDTEAFLKDDKDYHDKERKGYNAFLQKIGKPERDIWGSSSKNQKDKSNIVKKVKELFSPHPSKKSSQPDEREQNKILRDLTSKFLEKHQYFIHKDELEFKNQNQLEHNKMGEESIHKKKIDGREQSPQKTEKAKKGTFSKIKSYMVGSPKKSSNNEENYLLRLKTDEFLKNLRKYDTEHQLAESKHKIIWISSQHNAPKRKEEISEKPLSVKEKENIKKTFLVMKNETGTFLKDDKNYHDKERNEYNIFLQKHGKPEKEIWISSKSHKGKNNIVKKVKELFSPNLHKKIRQHDDNEKNKILRDQTSEFLKKHQYLIHKEEVEFPKQSHEVTEGSVAQKNIQTSEQLPQKNEKSKKGTFSKIKSYMVGSSKKPDTSEENYILRVKTDEFIKNIKKYDTEQQLAESNNKIVWKSTQQNAPMKKKDAPPKPLTQQEKEKIKKTFLIMKQDTEAFLKDDKDYHDKERSEYINFLQKHKKPEKEIWASSKSKRDKSNIVKKVRGLFSPNLSKKSAHPEESQQNKVLRDLTSQFLRVKTDEFLKNLKNYDADQQLAESKKKIVWISSQQSTPKKKEEISSKSLAQNEGTSKPLSHQEKELIRKVYQVMRKDTQAFLKDDKDYHDKERKEYNAFLQKTGKPERDIWASSSKNQKDKSNIVKKVKGLFSPHPSKKPSQPDESEQNKIFRDLTSKFLEKHQYFIHKDELEFKNHNQLEQNKMEEEPIQQKRIEVREQSPQKTEKAKKGTFSKIKSYMVGSAKKPDSNEESHLLKVKTDEFLKNLKIYDADQQLAESKQKIAWINNQQSVPKKKGEIPLKPLTDQEKEKIMKDFQHMKEETGKFLKDDKNYHDKERNEYNHFLQKHGKTEKEIWISSKSSTTKNNIVKKVKELFSPNLHKKLPEHDEKEKNKVLRDQTSKFLIKHQYLIHKEELEVQKPILLEKTTIEQYPVQQKKIELREQSPPKTEKVKKGTFSKIKSYMVGSAKKPDGSEESLLLRLKTDEFIKNLRKYDTEQQDAESKHKIIWKTNQENVPLKKKEVTSKPFTHQDKEQIRKAFLVMKNDTETFLKDDKDYHDKERKGYNNFLQKHKKPEKEIWASSKSPKDKSNIVKKVKELFSPNLSKKSSQPDENEQNKILRDLTSQFLKKHQYLIHKEEIEFKKQNLIKPNEALQNPVQEEKIEVTQQLPQKAEKAKKGTFSKIKSYMVGSAKKPDSNEENYLLRVKTDEFLKNLQSYDTDQQLAESKKKIVWISSQQSTPKEKEDISSKSLAEKETTSKPLSHQEKELIKKVYQIMKKDTEAFLKDDKHYHDKERKEYNAFLQKTGKPERDIWASSSKNQKDKSNIVKKVKELFSPHPSKKPSQLDEREQNKIHRDLTSKFLVKHQYFIHKDELEFKNQNQLKQNKMEEEPIHKKKIDGREQSPQKTEKAKKGTFSKIKSYMVGSPKKSGNNEENHLLRLKTDEFLKNLRKYDTEHQLAESKHKIIWISSQQNIPKRKEEITAKPLSVKEKENIKKAFLVMKNETGTFLKDDKDYHDKERNEYNIFLQKHGKPEREIWISSKPRKGKNNIVKKVKELFSPNLHKKTQRDDNEKNEILRDQTSEFLKKHQYLIHKEEVEFPKQSHEVTEDSVAQKNIQTSEQLPQKNEKGKKGAFSKIKSYMVGSSKKPDTSEENHLLRVKTDEFIKNLRKYDTEQQLAESKNKIVWKSYQQNAPKKKKDAAPKPLTQQEKEQIKKTFLVMKQDTEAFLKDDKNYHDKERNEYNIFLQKHGKPEKEIWISSKPHKGKNNIVKKVKELFSPNLHKKTPQHDDNEKNKILRDQTSEFLKKHQYLIHKEEIDIKKQKLNEKPVVEQDTMKPKLIKPDGASLQVSPKTSDNKQYLIISKKCSDFLTNHKEYHNKERNELNSFLQKHKKPENAIWLSSSKTKKPTRNIVTKVKNLFSSSKKNSSPDDKEINQIIRNQTLNFLQKNQYFIHQDEVEFRKHPIIKDKIAENEQIVPKKVSEDLISVNNATTTQKIPIKTKTFKTETTKKVNKDKNQQIKEKTKEFLEKLKEYDDSEKEIISKTKIVWLTEKPLVPERKKLKQTSNKNKNDHEEFLFIKNKTDIFLQNQKDYNNTYRKEHNEFLKKHGLPKNEISTPSTIKKEEKSILSKVKHLLSPKHSKKNLLPNEDEQNVYLKDKTAEFLKKHQYLIHGDEIESRKPKERKISKQAASLQKSSTGKTVLDQDIEREKFLHLLKDTESFLRNHQDYHFRERIEYLNFLKHQPPKEKQEKKNIITKVKGIFSNTTKPIAENAVFYEDVTENDKLQQSQETPKKKVTFLERHISIAPSVEDYPITPVEENPIPPPRKLKGDVKQQTEMFLYNLQDYHDMQNGDFIAFYKNKKETQKECPKNVKKLPQNSSQNEKIFKKEKEPQASQKIPTQEFLDKQRYYIDSENKIWKDFVKFNPEIVAKKSTPLRNEKKKQIPRPKTLNVNRKTSSEVESEKIDYQVILHKTKLFLDNHKEYHESQMKEFNEFQEKIALNPIEKLNKVTEKNKAKKGMISKLKSFVTGSQEKEKKEPKQDDEKEDSKEKFKLTELESSPTTYRKIKMEPLKKKDEAGTVKESSTGHEDRKILENSRIDANKQKIQTLDFLLNEKQARDAEYLTQFAPKTEPKKDKHSPTAPPLNLINEDSTLISRVITPVSPKKIIFKEIRSRENSPNRKVYLLSEGYIINKEENEEMPSDRNKKVAIPQNSKEEITKLNEVKMTKIVYDSDKFQKKKLMKDKEEECPTTSTGHTCGSKLEVYHNQHSKTSTQDDSEVRRLNIKRRTYREMETEPFSVISETKIVNNGHTTHQYTTSCYYHQVPTPVRYTESLLVDLKDKTKTLDEKIHYDNKFKESHWSETFATEVNPSNKMKYKSEKLISIKQEDDDVHYISLIPQQTNFVEINE